MKRLLISVAACAALAACGGGNDELDGAYVLQRDVKPYDVELERFVFSSGGKVELTISESDGNGGRSSRVEPGTYVVKDKRVHFTFGYSSGFREYTIDDKDCIYAYQSDLFCKS